MHPSFTRRARLSYAVALCAAALIGTGCHRNNLTSGYGISWVTVTNAPGDFAAYQVNIDSMTLTGKNVGVITAVGAVETVDITQLNDLSELWDAASIPNDTYTSATIVLDYTAANIAVIKDGAPAKAIVEDTAGVAVTTQTININFDVDHPLVIAPTYASTSALRLALAFDLAASSVVTTSAAGPVVIISPYITASTSASDTKPVRVRGPLINSSVNIGTYSVYVRPFFDEINSLGALSMFSSPTTAWLINGTYYTGSAGLSVISQLSAGTTMTAAYTTFEPTPDTAQSTSAGKFNANYVVVGSTLEDFYTQGLEGDVIARSSNTLTMRGSMVQFNDGTSIYYEQDATVVLGPGTIVTSDDTPSLTGLNYKSVSVGQHIIVRGIYSLSSSGVASIDATGTSSTNTGSVRIIPTPIYGSLVSAGAGGLVLNLGSISSHDFPVASYNFTRDGAVPVDPADYQVDTGNLALPAGTVAGSPVWLTGFTTPFGAAPPDFDAFAINPEVSVPARLKVDWTSAHTGKQFNQISASGLIINPADSTVTSAEIRIGGEIIDIKSLPTAPTIVPAAAPAPAAGLPASFLPLFAFGSVTTTDTTTIDCYNSFATFTARVTAHVNTSTAPLHLVANGYYNRGNNTFTANTINIVN
ncbi:MAG TPA: hypothetical protein VHV81_03805 [Steroidobacteraceae bacterium]|nr:hypothetical protein [Steroidobacteraceae bacterium]